MSLLGRLFGREELTDDEKRKRGERLDAKRRHLRGVMARNQGDLRRAWTEFRTWRGDEAGKKRLRADIKHMEAKRKELVKQMLRLQSEMKKLGYAAAAGHVDVH